VPFGVRWVCSRLLEATGEQDTGRTCAFCGYQGKLSGEHVWPEWVRNVILPDTRTGSYVLAEHRPGEPQKISSTWRADKLATLEVRRVCEDCNTNWMHHIEDAAIPVLERPIQGNPITLRGADLDAVATWAFLKCLVVTLATNKGHLLPTRLSEWMRRQQRPPRSVLILMACYGGNRHPLYASAGPVSFGVQVGTGEGTERHAYLLTIGVGHAVFQVFGHHIAEVINVKPTGWKRDVACLVWPKPHDAIRWPPRIPLTDATLFEFAKAL
jgi:hypothetical protein